MRATYRRGKLFGGSGKGVSLTEVLYYLDSIPSSVSFSAKSLIMMCLQWDEAKRWSVRQVLNSDWIQGNYREDFVVPEVDYSVEPPKKEHEGKKLVELP